MNSLSEDEFFDPNILPDVNVEKQKNILEATPKLKRGLSIQFSKGEDKWIPGEVVRRTGKAGGKYGNFWEVKNLEDNSVEEFDMVNDVDWKLKDYTEDSVYICDTFVVEEPVKSRKHAEICQAKNEEFEKWVEKAVFDEVVDEGQDRLSTTWVITTKEDKNQLTTKARLVIRGYEEMPEEQIRSDSPTCMKENVRMMLAVATSRNWKINTLDIKAAFLQGNKIIRDVYINPPKEFRKPGVLWKLNKVVYGLCDASRSWYLRIKEELIKLGMTRSKLDGSVFMYATEKLEGMVLLHVDDVLYFGSERFLCDVMRPFKQVFQISKDVSQAFRYLGIDIKPKRNGIVLSQNNYLSSLNSNLLVDEVKKDRTRYADENEKKLYKSAIGQLGWLTSVSKPEASFAYCTLSTLQGKPQISDFFKYNKIVRDLKNNVSEIFIGKLDFESLKVVVFSDAAFGNLPGGASQLGHIIFIVDNNNQCVPIAWASKKAKRVARSTLTAETLAAMEGVDMALMIKAMLEEITLKKTPPVTLYVDNKSLHDTVKTGNMLADKRLLIDMSALREMVDTAELKVEWVSTDRQLADVLTKVGVHKQKLMDVLSAGQL